MDSKEVIHKISETLNKESTAAIVRTLLKLHKYGGTTEDKLVDALVIDEKVPVLESKVIVQSVLMAGVEFGAIVKAPDVIYKLDDEFYSFLVDYYKQNYDSNKENSLESESQDLFDLYKNNNPKIKNSIPSVSKFCSYNKPMVDCRSIHSSVSSRARRRHYVNHERRIRSRNERKIKRRGRQQKSFRKRRTRKRKGKAGFWKSLLWFGRDKNTRKEKRRKNYEELKQTVSFCTKSRNHGNCGSKVKNKLSESFLRPTIESLDKISSHNMILRLPIAKLNTPNKDIFASYNLNKEFQGINKQCGTDLLDESLRDIKPKVRLAKQIKSDMIVSKRKQSNCSDFWTPFSKEKKHKKNKHKQKHKQLLKMRSKSDIIYPHLKFTSMPSIYYMPNELKVNESKADDSYTLDNDAWIGKWKSYKSELSKPRTTIKKKKKKVKKKKFTEKNKKKISNGKPHNKSKISKIRSTSSTDPVYDITKLNKLETVISSKEKLLSSSRNIVGSNISPGCITNALSEWRKLKKPQKRRASADRFNWKKVKRLKTEPNNNVSSDFFKFPLEYTNLKKRNSRSKLKKIKRYSPNLTGDDLKRTKCNELCKSTEKDKRKRFRECEGKYFPIVRKNDHKSSLLIEKIEKKKLKQNSNENKYSNAFKKKDFTNSTIRKFSKILKRLF